MIALKTLAKRIEDGLNSNTFGFSYAIHSDAGEYKKALNGRVAAQRKRYTNGCLQLVSSSVMPTQGLVVANETMRLEVQVQLFAIEPDANVIEAHRSILDAYFQAATKDVQMIPDESGDVFSVSSTYSLANTGVVTQPSPIGSSITFIVMITYGMVQNGLNSSKFRVTLDGAEIAYSSFTIANVPTMEGVAYSNSLGAAKNISTATALSFNLQFPATTPPDAANNAVMDFLLDGDMLSIHTLAITAGEKQKTYQVVFGESNVTLELPKNAGYSVTLVEAAILQEEE